MPKILLAEDSPTQAVEIRMLLEEEGHEVVHVANGSLAVAALEQHSIDLVVTDLEMPEMNGLELVERISMDFEHVPAILITARGSEELASQALRIGAASYVPKNHLRTLLNDTITDVLGVIRTDASFSKLISTLKKNVFIFDLPNDASMISPLVGLLMQVVSGMDLVNSAELTRIGVAIEHALVNAMYRGNLELGPSVTPAHRALVYDDATTDLIERRKQSDPYQNRRVHVEATASKEEVRVLIRDQGKGFDTTQVPGPGDPKVLNTESGRGLVLMASFMDELVFNESGTEVTMVKNVAGGR
jgi:CheY-like chemotaxis protein